MREEIDDRDEVRNEQREEDDLDRPPADESLTRPLFLVQLGLASEPRTERRYPVKVRNVLDIFGAIILLAAIGLVVRKPAIVTTVGTQFNRALTTAVRG